MTNLEDGLSACREVGGVSESDGWRGAERVYLERKKEEKKSHRKSKEMLDGVRV